MDWNGNGNPFAPPYSASSFFKTSLCRAFCQTLSGSPTPPRSALSRRSPCSYGSRSPKRRKRELAECCFEKWLLLLNSLCERQRQEKSFLCMFANRKIKFRITWKERSLRGRNERSEQQQQKRQRTQRRSARIMENQIFCITKTFFFSYAPLRLTKLRRG